MTAEPLEDPQQPTLIIRPSRGWRSLDLSEVWAYRELLYIFAWRDLKVRYRQTFLGALWVVGQPLLSMLIFTFLFNRVAKIQGPAGIPYPVFVFASLLMWNLFSNSASKSGLSLIGQGYLISKVYFPRLVVPLSGIAVELADLCVSGVMLAVLMVIYGVVPGIEIVFLPFVLLLGVLLSIAVGLWLAALNVEYRDVRVLIPFVMQIAMYATPVVYTIDAIPPKYRALVRLNPMTAVVESFRACLFGTPVDLFSIVWSVVVTIVLLIGGLYYFRKMERLFADVL